MRIRYNLSYTLSESSVSSEAELGRSSPWFGVNDMQATGGTFSQTILASASNVLIPVLGMTSARFIAIMSDQTITVAFNSSANTPITIQALGVGACDAIWIGTVNDVTAIYVSNPGAVNATVTFSIAGT